MTYRIEFTRIADRQFRDLPPDKQRQLQPIIDALAQTPRPSGVKKLKGSKDLYRVRSGNYRVIYKIEDKILLITVVTVGHRSDVYD